jgi:hypothetical protein
MLILTKCPKCRAVSGDDWTQCKKVCPMKGSPHYSEEARLKFGEPVVDRSVST